MALSSRCNGGRTADVSCVLYGGWRRPFPLVGRTWGFRSTPLVRQKISNWDTQLKVLGWIIDGWIIDTRALTVTFPSQKRLKLHIVLAE